MSEELATEEVVATPVADENVESSTTDEAKEHGTTDTPADTADAKQEEEPKRPSPGVQKRINELTSDKYKLKSENEELRQRLEAVEKQVQPQQPRKPRFDDFDTVADYESALEKYVSDQKTYELSAQQRQDQEKQRQEREIQERNKNAQNWHSKAKEQEPLFDDFWGAINDPLFSTIVNQYSPDIINLIWSSENGPALSYHLAKNIDEAEKIASLPPILAARELALLESRLDLPKPKTISNAPDPVKPAGTKSTIGKDPSQMTEKEFADWRKKQIAARR